MVSEIEESSIAVVGMAGRFPGAGSVSELWDLLKNGKEGPSEVSLDEQINAGVDKAFFEHPDYVNHYMKVDHADLFDADFFGYSPRQAVSIDPQQRIFLECAWEALESAGYHPGLNKESVGVFAGMGHSGHLFDILQHSGGGSGKPISDSMLDTDKDFLTGRVAYKLDLTGPSITVQTACSTSLVAVHLACQSLLTGECDVALAGGVRITKPLGYRYMEHGILSPDGHCRAFDAEAKGTIPGSGVGVVVLRRLADALKSGFQIHAVIRSTVVNNDGSEKIGFTAPGLKAQRQLLAGGLALAELQPSDIGYFEGHGTGTKLGDSIELTALKDVYGKSSKRCALGSIKTNIGHLDAAAGVAGLIKAILCLKNKALVPSVGFVAPNPILQESDCPLYVNNVFQPWERDEDRPRRAAVSSFGLGGTNAHAILEEAPQLSIELDEPTAKIFPLSARTPNALDRIAANLAGFLDGNPGTNLADIAFTLQIGRKPFPYRRTVVGTNHVDLAAALRDSKQDFSESLDTRPIVFLFPGEGSEWRGMARKLYQTEERFKEELDECSDRVAASLAFNVRQFLCDEKPISDSTCHPTAYTQSALFVFEYCLARLWMNWGINPSAMFGHGLGEYVAATLAGVLSIEHATRLIVERAKLISQMPEGQMVAIDLPYDKLITMHGPELAIAAVNSSDQCVIAGMHDPIDRFIGRLESESIRYRRLQVSHALHSFAMEPVAAKLKTLISGLRVDEPKIRYISGLTGTFVSGKQLQDPSYWGEHLVAPVRFSQGLEAVRDLHGAIFVEVGAGSALSDIARQHLGTTNDWMFLASMEQGDDRPSLLRTLGKMWCAGADVDWSRLHTGRLRRRVELPTYPFERRRFALDAAAPCRTIDSNGAQLATDLPMDERFYIPSWKESVPLPHWMRSDDANNGLWVVFEDEAGLGAAVTEQLKAADREVVSVLPAARYSKVDRNRFSINLEAPEDYARLMSDLQKRGKDVWRLIHCWSLAPESPDASHGVTGGDLDRGYRSLLFLTQAFARLENRAKCNLLAVSKQLFDIAGEGNTNSAKAAIAAICSVASQETAGLRCAVVDLPCSNESSTSPKQWKSYVNAILSEISFFLPDPIVAYRGSHRLLRAYERIKLDWKMPKVRKLRDRGVYLITGGLGKIGLKLAEELARTCQARIVLMSRSRFPERNQWDLLLSQGTEPASGRIRAVQRMEEAGGQVIISSADVSNKNDVQRVLGDVRLQFGELNGVFHLAGELSHQSSKSALTTLHRTGIETQIRPKVTGFHILDEELRGKGLDFGVVFSSNSSILGGVGFGAYAAGNSILDQAVLAREREDCFPWIVTNWDGWICSQPETDPDKELAERRPSFAVTSTEGMDALWRIVCLSTVPQVVISRADLQERFDTWVRQQRVAARDYAGEPPALVQNGNSKAGDETKAGSALERSIAGIWQELLGLDHIEMNDTFLDLGGDSLIAVRVSGRLRELVGISVPPEFFVDEDCTVEQLAKEVITRLLASHDPVAVQRYLDRQNVNVEETDFPRMQSAIVA